MQWKTTRNDNLSSRITSGGLHFISDVSHCQVSTVSCSHCQVLDYSLSAFPHFAHQLTTGQEQVSMTFQRPKNDPFSPYCNPGWRNHPNFSWSNGSNVAIPSSQPIFHPPNSFQRLAFQVCQMHIDLHLL